MANSAWRSANVEKLRKYRLEHYYRNREHYIAAATERKKQKRAELLATDLHFQKYIQEHPTKICSACGTEQATIDFPIKSSGGRRYPNHECPTCQNKRRSQGITPEQQVKRSKKRKLRLSENRNHPEFRAKFIVQDSRKSDKKYGRQFDLDIDFVEAQIQNGCFYCGRMDCLMVMDRKDNSLGHLKSNVNPACFRCNDIRSDMPYEAWLAVVPAIRDAYRQGLFGDWKNSRKAA